MKPSPLETPPPANYAWWAALLTQLRRSLGEAGVDWQVDLTMDPRPLPLGHECGALGPVLPTVVVVCDVPSKMLLSQWKQVGQLIDQARRDCLPVGLQLRYVARITTRSGQERWVVPALLDQAPRFDEALLLPFFNHTGDKDMLDSFEDDETGGMMMTSDAILSQVFAGEQPERAQLDSARRLLPPVVTRDFLVEVVVCLLRQADEIRRLDELLNRGRSSRFGNVS
ncbi:MAG TPA: hypothetical protein VHC22_24080 [Pirellulales bacterium]|nr:hypothetical protein [Pirellulales bacterium]